MFNKKEFFEEYNIGEIYALENAEKQILIIKKDLYEKMKENQRNIKISYKKVQEKADKLCAEEEKITKIQEMIKFVKKLNSIYVETETTNYASNYNSMTFELYNKAFNDLMNLLNISDQDFVIFNNKSIYEEIIEDFDLELLKKLAFENMFNL